MNRPPPSDDGAVTSIVWNLEGLEVGTLDRRGLSKDNHCENDVLFDALVDVRTSAKLD